MSELSIVRHPVSSQWLIGNDTNRITIDADKANDNLTGKINLDFTEITPVLSGMIIALPENVADRCGFQRDIVSGRLFSRQMERKN